MGTGRTLHFEVRGLPASKARLYAQDMHPVYRSLPSMPEWRAISTAASSSMESDAPDTFTVRFSHRVDTPPDEWLCFAFCYPYGYVDCVARLAWLDGLLGDDADEYARNPHLLTAAAVEACMAEEAADADNRASVATRELMARAAAACVETLLPARAPSAIYYRRELLTRSLDGRRIDLLTLTADGGRSDELEPPLPPPLLPDGAPRPHRFPTKKVVVVAARVHPGETPASHVFDGLLQFLLRDSDPRAAAARDRFVFKLIPMLNPDGVARGHYRSDGRGVDLNRTYLSESHEEHPSTFAAMALVRALHGSGELHAYIDTHAHANQRGCFFYTCALPSAEARAEAATFARLMALNCRWFELAGCTYRHSGIHAGSARSAIFGATGLPLVFTLECNYDSAHEMNVLPPRHAPTTLAYDDEGSEFAEQQRGRMSPEPSRAAPEGLKYTPAAWREVGRAIALALLDMDGANPASRLGPDGGAEELAQVRSTVKWFDEYVELEDDEG